MVNEKQKHQHMQALLKSHWLKIPKAHQSAFLLKSEKIALDEYNWFNARALAFLNDAFYKTFHILKVNLYIHSC